MSRTNLFTNIILKDLDKFKFQKYVTTGQRIKKHLKEIKFKEKRTLRDLNIIWYIMTLYEYYLWFL